MGSLLDGLSYALTAGTKAAAAQQQGRLGASQILRAIMMQQAEIEHLNAQTDQARADAAFTSHKNRQPLPGDAGYTDTMIPVWSGQAGAEASAKYPFQLGVVNAQNQGRLGAARIGAGATTQAATIGANSRQNVANIEQGGANTRQTNQQMWDVTHRIPAQTAGTQSVEQYKEGGEIIPTVVRPINNGIRALVGAQPLGASSPGAAPSGALPSAKPTITPTERAALIAKGHAPADVDANYTVQGRPGTGSSW